MAMEIVVPVPPAGNKIGIWLSKFDFEEISSAEEVFENRDDLETDGPFFLIPTDWLDWKRSSLFITKNRPLARRAKKH